MAGAYKRLPHDDDGKPIERSDHSNKLWVVSRPPIDPPV